MIPHPQLPLFLRLAYDCMGCDGEVAESEVSCLRSIAVQLGQPVAEVDLSLSSIRAEFSSDAAGSGALARRLLRDADLTTDDATLLLDILVQMVEADGRVQTAETRYIRDLVDDLGLDRVALGGKHPEWQPYLIEDIRFPRTTTWAGSIDPGEFGSRELPHDIPEIAKE